MMTEERLSELEALADAATKGPWEVKHEDYGDEWWFGGSGCGQVIIEGDPDSYPGIPGLQAVYGGHDTADAAFIAAARTAVPELISEVRGLRAERDAAIARAEKAEAEVARLRGEIQREHKTTMREWDGEEVESREVDGLAMIAPCECYVPRQTLDATVPAEPGAYWAIVRGATVPSLVEVRSNGGGLFVLRCGSDRIHDIGAFDLWSARLPEPEVKP